MSYTLYFETAGRRGVTLWAETPTVSANRALSALHARTVTGLTAWIRCGNGQVITMADLT
jgi:hypothetical protein